MAPYIDFKGNAESLIDFSTWPGASGSMVLLYKDQGWIDRRGNTMMGGMRVKLVASFMAWPLTTFLAMS